MLKKSTFATIVGSANCELSSSCDLFVLLLVVVGGVLVFEFVFVRRICTFIREYFIDDAVNISIC